MRVIVFPEDFVHSKAEQRCKTDKDDVLKEFSYHNELMTNSSMALRECEEYCVTDERCWGCTGSCTDLCRSYAITGCKDEDKDLTVLNQHVSQKPGKHANSEKLYLYT